MNLEIIRVAKVEINPINSEGGYVAGLDIHVRSPSGNIYKHTFGPTSREAKMVAHSDLQTVKDYFNGGTYTMFNGRLVDYRPSVYKGFIHSDENVGGLIETLGATEMKSKSGPYTQAVNPLFAQSRSSGNNGFFLGGEWDNFSLDVAELGEGGQFNNALIYKWSPFSANIVTSLEVERLICRNGMVANAPFVTYEVPVINAIQENLTVVFNQLKPKLEDVMAQRFLNMADSRASVLELSRAHDFLNKRERSLFDIDYATGKMKVESNNFDAAERLNKMAGLIDPQAHLGTLYDKSVFKDNKIASGVAGHISQFDLYNVVTEAASHYGSDEMSNREASQLCNRLVFDSLQHGRQLTAEVPKAPESDHRRAFFGGESAPARDAEAEEYNY